MSALLLDLDRTLIDVQTYTDYSAALDEVLEALGEVPEADVPATGWDSPTRACMQILVGLSGDPRWEEASSLIESHELAALPEATPMPGLGGFLEALPNDLPVAVVTLLGPIATDRVLEMHEVPIATRIGRRPDLTPKPAPDQLLAACRLLGVDPSEATMVGDSTWDLRAAEAAGTAFIGVTNRGDSEFPVSTEVVQDMDELTDRFLISGTGARHPSAEEKQ